MKKLFLVAFTALSLSAVAQEDKEVVIEKSNGKSPKKETQEIIIRSKGNKEKNITVHIDGDKVTINGKPVTDFKDEDITINKRNITIFDGKNKMMFNPMDDMEVLFKGDLNGTFKSENDGAFLGVTSILINDDNNNTPSDGVKVTNVSKGSAADKAGIKEGDIITKINTTKIENPSALSDAIGDKKPKDEVTITYKRDGKENTTKAVLGQRKGNQTSTYSFTGPDGKLNRLSIPRSPRMPNEPGAGSLHMWNDDELGNLNMDLGKLDGQFNNFDFNFPRRPKIGLKIQDVEEGSGVKVLGTDEDSPAAKAGIKKDDIITEINSKAVNNTDDARELLKPEEGKNTYTIKAKRNGSAMSFDVKIPKKLKTADL